MKLKTSKRYQTALRIALKEAKKKSKEELKKYEEKLV